MFEQRPEKREEVIIANVWGKNIPHGMNSKSNGSGVGTKLAFSRNSKKASMVRVEATKED